MHAIEQASRRWRLNTQQQFLVVVERYAAPADALGHEEAGRRQLRVRAPLREVRAQDLARGDVEGAPRRLRDVRRAVADAELF